MRAQVKFFWTIWALSWWRVKSFDRRTLEFKLFIGPAVVTWWR